MSDEVIHRSEWRPACLGGWCHRRDRCQHHHADDRRHTVERMCQPGNAFEHFSPRFDPRFAAWIAGQPEQPA